MVLFWATIGICGMIAYQDFSEREVYWWAFPLLGIALLTLHHKNVLYLQSLLLHIGINLLMVLCILGILYLYTVLIAKKAFLNHSLGLGDILFFGALALGFPSFTFTIVFVLSIWFSLMAYMALKRGFKKQTVPLAGFMAVFLSGVLVLGQFVSSTNLYLY